MNDEDFEVILLGCGHSVNQYSGIGACWNCGKKCCGKCLELLNAKLLCPDCFSYRMGGGHE